MAELTYLETTDDNSVQAFGFSSEGGAATGTYQFGDKDSPVTRIEELQSAVEDILGTTNTDVNGSPNLRRKLPCTHPAFPYLYASQISGMVGMGSKDAEKVAEVVPPITGNPQAIADKFNLYKRYQIKTNFGTRNYTILPDEQVSNQSGSWFPKGTLASSSPTSFTYAPEWIRYTDYEVVPQNNTIQGQTGSFTFRGGTPDGKVFTSPPWMYLPDSVIKFTWYQVPYRYITSENSYIANRGWLGCVNQNDWYNWEAGHLLYLSYNVKKYSQPTLRTQTTEDYNGNSWTSYSKLCDIEFTFLYTSRTPNFTPPDPDQGNWVYAGHNLLPYFPTRGFYIATAGQKSDGPDKWIPAWDSAPFECLFSDPDAEGGP